MIARGGSPEMVGSVARRLSWVAALVLAAALPALAGGAGEKGKKDKEAEAFNENAAEDALQGFKAYAKRDYAKARPLLEKALAAGHEGDTCRSFLARIAFF